MMVSFSNKSGLLPAAAALSAFLLLAGCGGGGGGNATGSTNAPPTANSGIVTTVVNQTVTAAFSAVDPDGDPLTYSIVVNGQLGSATIIDSSSGTFRYVASASGTDTISFHASDGVNISNTADVTVNVAPSPPPPPNTPPVANNDAYGGISEGGTFVRLATVGVLANDTDAENDPLTALIVSLPAYGTLQLNSDGSFTYTHDGSETTADSFTYKVSDGTDESSVATVSLSITPVNDPPVANDDAYGGIDEGGVYARISPIGVLSNDSDAENDPMTVTLASGPSNGTLTLEADGAFVYTHDGSETVSDSFTYTVSDGQGTSSPATVTLSINPVNDPPIASDDSAIANENTPEIIDVLANDTDADGTIDPSSVVVTSQPANGAASANPDGTVTYTPDTGFTGPATDSFQYTVNDNSGATSSPATVTVTMNVPPTPVAGCSATAQTSPVSGTLSATDPETPTLLTFSLVSDGAKGTVNLSSDGSYTYTPNSTGPRGRDTFTYQVTDIDGGSSTGTETVIIDQHIMPLGDSITMGTNTTGVPAQADRVGFRKPLFDSLSAAGYRFDFTGSQQDGWNLLSDYDHEGHGGWSDEQIAWGATGTSPGPPPDPNDGIYAWLNQNPSDIILLHIGTNVFHTDATHVAEILDEIDRWEADNYPVTVVLGRIINRSTPDPDVTTFNDNVIAMAQSRISNPADPAYPDNIIIVDHENALTYPSDMYDALHPTDGGYAKMANVWLYPLAGAGTQTGTGTADSTGAYTGSGILEKCP